ncbi:SDR family oxidoreductase [Nocardioides sp. CFH 31398]|uniref:SDR family oxidoreductase n=1 Tax=Nocardioides sp. CFH 31398 TaxID=2919579 RepID=UPI001F057871|nr:NAD(P)H-binding protein [Nocardioides sp. CFH 31398]MCH1865918.1 NAD(P)H-binding protein [Nocardioides sp. CFH 31398]
MTPTRRVAVLAGRGKTGRAVGAALARRGVDVVPLGRGSVVAEETAGCDAAYVIAPNLHPAEPAYAAAALDALRTAGVGRVVYHSVASPYAPAMPHHVGKAAAEDLVRRSGLAWTVLQPGPYLQNLDLTADLVVPYDVDAVFGFADLAEVGEAAAVVLTEDGHVGATYELATRVATVADLAREAGVTARRGAPDLSALDPREADWLRAMFASYDAHGLPVGTRVLDMLLGR